MLIIRFKSIYFEKYFNIYQKKNSNLSKPEYIDNLPENVFEFKYYDNSVFNSDERCCQKNS